MSDVPSEAELERWIERVERFGPRLNGSDALSAFVDYLDTEFTRLGLIVERDQFEMTRWDAGPRSLTLEEVSGTTVDVPVASYMPYSGSTPYAGVVGEPVALGDVATATIVPEAVRDKIVLVDYAAERIRHPYERVWGIHDPTGNSSSPDTWVSTTRNWVTLDSLRKAAARAGAIGLVACWTNISEDSARDQYQPLVSSSVVEAVRERFGVAVETEGDERLPGLWVGPAAREIMLSAARRGDRVRLVLRSRETPAARLDGIVATLPGLSDEIVVVATHTDGVNASQENGWIGLLGLATVFARRRTPPGRTLCFLGAAAHMVSGLSDVATGAATPGETEAAIEHHPELIDRAVAALGLEHLGHLEWVDDGESYRPTGGRQWAHCLTRSGRYARILEESLKGTDSGPVLIADGNVWGVVRPFAKAGIPTASYGQPVFHMAQFAPNGHVDKLSTARLRAELTAFAHVLDRLCTATAVELRGV
jgi:hypothetical protein